MRESHALDLRNVGETSEPDLERDVRKLLSASGMEGTRIDETAVAVARKLREHVENEVRDRPSGRPRSDGSAPGDLASSANEAAKPRAGSGVRTPEVISGKAWIDRLLVAGFSRPGGDDAILKAQLREQEKTNAKLDEIREWTKKPGKPTYATFARGRL